MTDPGKYCQYFMHNTRKLHNSCLSLLTGHSLKVAIFSSLPRLLHHISHDQKGDIYCWRDYTFQDWASNRTLTVFGRPAPYYPDDLWWTSPVQWCYPGILNRSPKKVSEKNNFHQPFKSCWWCIAYPNCYYCKPLKTHSNWKASHSCWERGRLASIQF